MADGEEEDGLQRNIFPWIGYDDPFKDRQQGIPPHKTITADEIVKKHGVPREEIQKHIQKEMEESANFRSLPFTIFFVAAFAMFVVSHDDAVVIRAVEESIEFDITENANWRFEDNGNMGHKGVEDIETVQDFYSWATQGFIPLIFQQQNFFAELRNMSEPIIIDAMKEFQPEQRGILLNHNMIIGGIRFRQSRHKETKCPSSDVLGQFYPGPCYGTALYNYELDPETWTARGATVADNDTWFYVWEDQSDMIERLRLMEATDWITPATARVEISLPVYNAEFGLHTLVSINFLFSRGGEIWKIMLPHSTYAVWWTYWFYAIYDICWVLALLSILYSEMAEICWFCRHKTFKTLFTEYLNFWNIVDWTSMIVGFAIMGLSLASWGETARVNEETQALADISLDDTVAYAAQTDAYMKALETVLRYIHRLKMFLAAYPMIIVMRLFKAFAAQPRLALVTNTLITTGVDICHFMVVFGSIFTTIAISGLVLFGRQIGEFTTLLRSMNTVFRLMLGDFDYVALSHVGRMEGAMWLFGSIIVLNLLMLNIVLAIVMDGYSEVKKSAAGGDTLFMEIRQAWSRFWNERSGKWVPMGVIYNALLAVEMERKLKDMQFHMADIDAAANFDPDAPKVVGLDSKAVVGLRVIPRDHDIAHFVKEGKIEVVGTTGLQVRVRHEDGAIREYDTGRDLNYQLILAEGEKMVDFDDQNEETEETQVISAERLMKIVGSHNRRYRMAREQAMELCHDTVMKYYKENSEGVDLDIVLQTARKIKFRIQKIGRVVDEGNCQTLSSNAPEQMKMLRSMLRALYKKVDEERQTIHEEMNRINKRIKGHEARLKEQEMEGPDTLHGPLPRFKGAQHPHHTPRKGTDSARWSSDAHPPRRRSLTQGMDVIRSARTDFGEDDHHHHHHQHTPHGDALKAFEDVALHHHHHQHRDEVQLVAEDGFLDDGSVDSREEDGRSHYSGDSVMDEIDDDELLHELDHALQESYTIRKRPVPGSLEDRAPPPLHARGRHGRIDENAAMNGNMNGHGHMNGLMNGTADRYQRHQVRSSSSRGGRGSSSASSVTGSVTGSVLSGSDFTDI